jgi:hypothetical protein
MNTNATRYTMAASVVLAAVFAVTGCTAGGSAPAASHTANPSGQTHAQACAVVAKGLKEIAGLQGELSSVMGDPAKSSALMNKVDSAVKAIDEKVVDADVKKVTSAAAAAADDYAGYLHKAVSDPKSIDVTEVQTRAEDLATTFTAVQKECS